MYFQACLHSRFKSSVQEFITGWNHDMFYKHAQWSVYSCNLLFEYMQTWSVWLYNYNRQLSITFSHILTYTVRYQTVFNSIWKLLVLLFSISQYNILYMFKKVLWTKKGLAICRAYNTIYRSRSKTKHLTGKKEEISERAKQKQSLFQDGQTCIRFHMSREYRNDECNVTQWKERQNNNIRWVTTHSGKTGGLG